VEFSLEAASEADIKVFKNLQLDLLPEGSIIFADKGYTDYDHEDLLQEAGGLHLKAQRKKRSKRPMPIRGRSSWANRSANTSRRSSAG
jgi:hypothetical protein